MAGKRKVEFFGLSTCGWCRKTGQWLDDHGVEYHRIFMDTIDGDELETAKARVKEFIKRISYPVLVIDDGERVVQGYHVEDFEEAFCDREG